MMIPGNYRKLISLVVVVSCFAATGAAQDVAKKQPAEVDPRPFADNSNHWYMGFSKSNLINARADQPRYKPSDLTGIGDNILLFQKSNGGWPKNYDVFAILTAAQKDSVLAAKNVLNTTFDNGSCFTQIDALATIYAAVPDQKYKSAALKGLDFLLEAQYKNGGWPQYYPLESNYSKAITFNDGVFTGIMELLSNICRNDPKYGFIPEPYRKKITDAYNRGLDCVLKTQINDTGKLTAWCQQHDPVTLLPVWARKFEPASICNAESADLVLFLMKIEHPDQKIINAVRHAVTWFQDSRIYNTRVNTVPAPKMVTSFRVSTTDKVVVTDTTAKPIWTRYYELKTHRPIFCNRDSKIVYTLAEVDRERRDGYAWYTYSPQKVLDRYQKWQAKWVP
jgi:PelA/Pel-15E family pectate lyase